MPPKKETTVLNGLASPSFDAPERKENKQKPVWTPFAPPPRKALHPPTMIMVKEALKELDSQKGVSSQAIRNCIAKKYPAVDYMRLKYMVRKAVIKGIESGMLVRPAKAKVAIGAQGRFLLAPKKVKEPKGKTENMDPNATKTTVKKSTEDEKGGASKKKDAVKREPAKKVVDSGTKVAPAKKPKAKKTAEEDSQPTKPKVKKTTENRGGNEEAIPTKAKAKKTAAKEESHPTKAKAKKTAAKEDSHPTIAKAKKTTDMEGGEEDFHPTKAKTSKNASSEASKPKAVKGEGGAAKSAGKRGKKTAE